MVISTKDIENILKITAMIEYFIIQRTIKLSKMVKDKYNETRHHMAHNTYSEALPVIKFDKILISLFAVV